MACGGCSSDKSYTLEFLNKVAISAKVESYEFKALEHFEWQEGSRADLQVPVKGEMVGQTYALVSLIDEEQVAFAVTLGDKPSDYKDQLGALVTGDLIEMSEPCGDFMLRREERPIILLSKEEGIVYFRSMIKAFEKNDRDIGQLIQINIASTDPIYQEAFEAVANRMDGFKSFYVRDGESFYKKVTFESQQLMASMNQVPYFYIVGEDSFVQEASAFLVSLGIDQEDIITESDQSQSGCSGCSGGGCSGCSEK